MLGKSLLILLICSLSLTSTLAFTEENHVLVLTKDDFDSAINSFENVLVEFYAPWCGHCKRLAPEFEKVAEALKIEGSKTRLAKVDATVETELAQNYGVNGFPTLMMFIKGERTAYTGGRTAPTIMDWIRKKTETPSTYVNSLSDLQEAIKKHEAIVLFYGDELDWGFKPYWKVASRNMDTPFFHTTSREIMGTYNPNGDVKVQVLKSFEEGFSNFEEDFTEEAVEKFVLSNRFHRIMPYNNKYAKVIFGDKNAAVFVITGRGDSTDKALQALTSIEEKLRGKILFTTCEYNDELCGKVAKYLGVKRDDVPAVAIIKPVQTAQRSEKYIYEGKVTAENLLQWFEDYENNKTLPLVISEEIPEKNEEAVKVLVGRNYHDIVFDEHKDVIVFYTDSNCEECKEYFTMFQSLARLLEPIEDVILGKIDLNANQVRDFNFPYLPQVVLYTSKDKKHPIVYRGDKDVKALYETLKGQFTVAFDDSLINVDEVLETIKRETEEKERADEISRQKLEELEASQKAREEAQAQADAAAHFNAAKYAHEQSQTEETKKDYNSEL